MAKQPMLTSGIGLHVCFDSVQAYAKRLDKGAAAIQSSES
jgi:hypothetical protein